MGTQNGGNMEWFGKEPQGKHPSPVQPGLEYSIDGAAPASLENQGLTPVPCIQQSLFCFLTEPIFFCRMWKDSQPSPRIINGSFQGVRNCYSTLQGNPWNGFSCIIRETGAGPGFQPGLSNSISCLYPHPGPHSHKNSR